jgi:hypothetical protein
MRKPLVSFRPVLAVLWFALIWGQAPILEDTNDNLDAVRFYQRLGFELKALRPGAVKR